MVGALTVTRFCLADRVTVTVTRLTLVHVLAALFLPFLIDPTSIIPHTFLGP